MQGNIVADKFGYKITIKDRGILSVVCSIYDPLGFASTFALEAKTILQDLCRNRMGWV